MIALMSIMLGLTNIYFFITGGHRYLSLVAGILTVVFGVYIFSFIYKYWRKINYLKKQNLIQE